jgi:hypothetical protein
MHTGVCAVSVVQIGFLSLDTLPVTPVQALADIGYREGQDLFGAPYDFRLAADGLDQVAVATALSTVELVIACQGYH